MGDVDAPVPVVVFSPLARVALVVIEVFNTPLPPNGGGDAVLFLGREAADEVPDVSFLALQQNLWVNFGSRRSPSV